MRREGQQHPTSDDQIKKKKKSNQIEPHPRQTVRGQIRKESNQ